MKCNVCETESLNATECTFCGESSKLEFFETRELKQPNEKLLRLKLNNWANSISDHEFTNLGEQVTFKKINSHPAHAFGVETVYEKRELSYRYFIGNKNRTKNRTIDIRDIDPWKLGLDYKNGESKDGKVTAYNLLNDNNTVHTVDCEANGCNSGAVDCGDCNGKGEYGCSNCRATGEIDCKACNGSGEQSRNGNYFKCSRCGGGKTENCGPCQASGYVKCSTCRSTGSVACANCEGNGVLDQKILLTGILRATVDYHLENERHPADVKKFHSYDRREGIILMNIENGSLPETAKEIVPIQGFQDKLNRVIAEHDVFPADTRVARRSIWIERKPLIEINYALNGSDFRLFLVDSKFSPIDDSSPIKNFNKELVEQSSKFLTSSNLSEVKKGIENLEKSFRIGQDQSSAEKSYEGFKEHLGNRILKSAEAISTTNWTDGMEMIYFRDRVLHRKTKASSKYLSDNVKGMVKVLVLTGLILTAVALGAARTLAASEFFVTEIMGAFAVLSLALTAITIGNAVNGMQTNVETKKLVMIKFVIAMVLCQIGFVLSVTDESRVLLLLGLACTFIPRAGSFASVYSGADELNDELDEDDRKVILTFLEKYKAYLYR